MSIAPEITGVAEVKTYISRLPERLFEETKKTIGKSTLSLQKTMTSRVTSGPLKRRSGALARSFHSSVRGADLKSLRGSVYTGSSYAPIHEYGGIVKAKRAYRNLPNGPYLNIPIGQNLTTNGRIRKSAREVFGGGGYIIPSKGPKARYVVMLNGVPMFVLVKQVTIKAQLGMRHEANLEVKTLLSNLAKSTGEAIQ